MEDEAEGEGLGEGPLRGGGADGGGDAVVVVYEAEGPVPVERVEWLGLIKERGRTI